MRNPRQWQRPPWRRASGVDRGDISEVDEHLDYLLNGQFGGLSFQVVDLPASDPNYWISLSLVSAGWQFYLMPAIPLPCGKWQLFRTRRGGSAWNRRHTGFDRPRILDRFLIPQRPSGRTSCSRKLSAARQLHAHYRTCPRHAAADDLH